MNSIPLKILLVFRIQVLFPVRIQLVTDNTPSQRQAQENKIGMSIKYSPLPPTQFFFLSPSISFFKDIIFFSTNVYPQYYGLYVMFWCLPKYTFLNTPSCLHVRQTAYLSWYCKKYKRDERVLFFSLSFL